MKKFMAVLMLIIAFLPGVFAHSVDKNSDVENEEIDIVYTYVDLTDENLHRDGVSTCKKDYSNEELRYSLRSVLQNIPWVRKIFIIMPNDKVNFLKDKSKISDKIVYIKDKDFLGFDSSSSVSFEFNFWRLKDFGCSENFIYMNDDFFIGKPLKKSDFFYRNEEGRVVPYVLYGKNIDYGQYGNIRNYWYDLKYDINSLSPHSNSGFEYQRMSTFMFLYDKVFNRDIKAPSEDLNYFPHNALGENLTDLKEIYDLVLNKYEHANECLFARSRNNYGFQHQTMYCFYLLNKYNRKMKKISGSYIDLEDAFFADYSSSLFCINTGGDVDYTELDYTRAKIKMAELFPKRTKYEKPEISEGTYMIISKLNYNKCLDIEWASPENCANLHLFERNDSVAQKFYLKYNFDGTYTIIPKCSGKAVDVEGAGSEMGTNIWQYEKNGTDAQKWYIIPDRQGYFHIISKCNGLSLDVDGAIAEDWTNIQCWEINDSDAQKFKFVK